MAKITLTNEFHRTRTTVDTDCPLTPERVRRIRARLCGIDTCTCGDTLGVRGPVDDPEQYLEFRERAEQCMVTGYRE